MVYYQNWGGGDHRSDAQMRSERSIGDHARLTVECQTKGRSNARDERGIIISARHRKQSAELAVDGGGGHQRMTRS